MEFVEGETLAQWLPRVASLPRGAETPFGLKSGADYYRELATAFAGVADGLQQAHSRGVIHRDIKPSNLILDTEGRLRILDFGLAHLEGDDSLTRTGDFVGTPLYVSPEQARRAKVPLDHRTDVYSLGATLYESLTGEPPFRGSDRDDTLSQVISREPRPPRQLDPQVPRDLETIVLKCLRKEPIERFGTAEALAQDLRRFTRDDPIEAQPETSWARLGRTVRRRWRGWVALVAVTVLLLITAILTAREWRAWHARQEAEYAGELRKAVAEVNYAAILYDIAPGRVSRVRQHGWHWRVDPDDPCAPDSLAGHESRVERLEAVARKMPGRLDAAYHLAQLHLRRGKFEEALAGVDAALRADATLVPLLALRPLLLRQLGRDGEAEAALLLLRGLDTNGLGDSVHRAHQAWLAGEWDEAERHLRALQLLLVDHEATVVGLDLEARLLRSAALLEAGRLEEAGFEVARAQPLYPDLPEPGMLLGMVLALRGEYDLAEAELRSTISGLDGDERERRARESVAILDSQWALDQALRMVDLVENEYLRLREQAYLSARTRREPVCVEEGRRAVEIRPEDPRGWGVLALTLAQANQKDAARNAIQEAIRLGTEDWHTCHLVAWAHWNLGDREQSDDWNRRAIQSGPPWVPSLANLALSHMFAGDYPEAIRLLERLIAANPADFYAYYLLAITYRRMGRLEDAEAQLSKSRHLQPGHAGTSIERARIERARGHLKEADRLFREALGQAGNDIGNRVSALRGLGEIYEQLDVPALALEYYRDAIEAGGADRWLKDKVAELEAALDGE